MLVCITFSLLELDTVFIDNFPSIAPHSLCSVAFYKKEHSNVSFKLLEKIKNFLIILPKLFSNKVQRTEHNSIITALHMYMIKFVCMGQMESRAKTQIFAFCFCARIYLLHLNGCE